MKSKIALLILASGILFGCKTFKDKRSCKLITSNKEALKIESFEQVVSYLNINEEILKNVLWILDGRPYVQDEISKIIDNKDFDILNIEHRVFKEGNIFCKPHSNIILIVTNSCLKKYN